MVTLSLLLYRKKELKSSRSVDDFARSGQGPPLRIEVPPVIRRALTHADLKLKRSPPPERRRPGPNARNSAAFYDECCN